MRLHVFIPALWHLKLNEEESLLDTEYETEHALSGKIKLEKF